MADSHHTKQPPWHPPKIDAIPKTSLQLAAQPLPSLLYVSFLYVYNKCILNLNREKTCIQLKNSIFFRFDQKASEGGICYWGHKGEVDRGAEDALRGGCVTDMRSRGCLADMRSGGCLSYLRSIETVLLTCAVEAAFLLAQYRGCLAEMSSGGCLSYLRSIEAVLLTCAVEAAFLTCAV